MTDGGSSDVAAQAIFFIPVLKYNLRAYPGQSTVANTQSRRRNPQIGLINNTLSALSANYNSAQVSFNKRYSRGFTVLGSYTFSKAMGIGTGSVGAGSKGPRNPNNYQMDHSALSLNRRQNFVADASNVGRCGAKRTGLHKRINVSKRSSLPPTPASFGVALLTECSLRGGPYPPEVRLVKMLERCGRFLDPLARSQLPERSPRVVQGAMQDLLDRTHALDVQALLSLHRTKMHERITDELLSLRRHEPSIQ
jgi:hypothetical protein